jgi:hypothetical protein
MSKLYFGVCPYGTVCDVFINTLAGWSDEWVQPCTPDITNTGHLIHNNHEQYVLDLTNNNPMQFRNIDWTDRLSDIEAVLSNAGDKKVWIGNFSSKQARLIKKHFGSDATTVGITYTPNTRDLVLENVITYYSGLSTETDKEKYNVGMNVRYQMNKDKWEKMVPYSFQLDTDFSIDLADFLKPDNYIDAVEQIDGLRNEKQLEYYFTWLFRTKERLNENK